MKKIFKKISVIFLSITLLMVYIPLYGSTIHAAEKSTYKKLSDDKVVYYKYKPLTITLSGEVDKNSIKKNSVFIEDNNGKVYDTEVKVSKDNKKIIVSAPEEGYKEELRYTVYIKNIKSKKGNMLKENVKQSFRFNPNIKEENEKEAVGKYELKKGVIEIYDADNFGKDSIKVLDDSNLQIYKDLFKMKPKKGNSVWIKPTDKYLDGIIFKIKSIEEKNNYYTIQTEKATLTDVFENLIIKENFKLNENETKSKRRLKRSLYDPDMSKIKIKKTKIYYNEQNIKVDFDLKQKIFDVNAKIRGKISITESFEGSLDFQKNQDNEDTKIKVEKGKDSKEKKYDIEEKDNPFKIIIPTKIAGIRFEGEINFEIEGKITLSNNIEIENSIYFESIKGVKYNKEKNKFEYYSKKLSKEVEFKVNINSKIESELESYVKVSLKIKGGISYLENFNIDILSLNCKLGFGVFLDIQGKDEISIKIDLLDDKKDKKVKFKDDKKIDLEFLVKNIIKIWIDSEAFDLIKYMIGNKYEENEFVIYKKDIPILTIHVSNEKDTIKVNIEDQTHDDIVEKKYEEIIKEKNKMKYFYLGPKKDLKDEEFFKKEEKIAEYSYLIIDCKTEKGTYEKCLLLYRSVPVDYRTIMFYYDYKTGKMKKTELLTCGIRGSIIFDKNKNIYLESFSELRTKIYLKDGDIILEDIEPINVLNSEYFLKSEYFYEYELKKIE